MPRLYFLGLLILSLVPASMRARADLLLVPPTGVVADTRNLELTLHLNNPSDREETVDLSHALSASYASRAGRGRMELEIADASERVLKVAPMTRRTVVLRVREKILAGPGFVSVRLTEPESNVIMFDYQPAPGAPALPLPAARRIELPTHDLDLATDVESMRRHISGYEPIYFALGARERLNARFQFSFKFRFFEAGLPEDDPLKRFLRGLHLAYTQTSIWDLESFSKPFYDSSYRPTLFVVQEKTVGVDRSWRLGFQAGAQHESNGKGGGSAPLISGTGLISAAGRTRHSSDTRSLNTLYFEPRARWESPSGWFLEARARAIAYFQMDENPDLPRYRGYVELSVRGGQERGRQLSVHVRGNPRRGHGSMEFNYTWPAPLTLGIGRWLPPSLGGYGLLQYFNGYGESLLDYDVRRKDQLRLGVTIVR